MWKLKRVVANNIVSFRELDMDIEQGVASLIFGQNLDNENQKANGSGKSSLIEAISFGITGETLRKVKAEEIINDSAEEAGVTLTFENDYDNTTFIVNRTISRSSAQVIECHKFNSSNMEIETDKTIQPSVLDYNKFILDEIGLTKDEIYANFILCRNKYTSFFDASDREKKEIINRFSNGILVDESIAKLQEDLEPAEEDLRGKEQNVSRVSGKIEAVNEQIAEANQKKEEAARTREQAIESLRDKIANKREEIRTTKEKIGVANDRLDLIDEFGDRVEQMEKDNKSFGESYDYIKENFEKLKFEPITDYLQSMCEQSHKLDEAKHQMETLKSELEDLEAACASTEKVSQEALKKYEAASSSTNVENNADKAKIALINKEIDKFDSELTRIQSEIKEEKRNYNNLDMDLASANNILHGAITCPKCHHQFLLSNEKSLEDVQAEKKSIEAKMKESKQNMDSLVEENDKTGELVTKKEREIADIKAGINERNDVLQKVFDEKRVAQNNLSELQSKLNSIRNQINTVQTVIDSANGQIDNMRKRMFDEVFGVIDSKMDAGEQYIKNLKEHIEHCNATIEQYQQNITELENSKTGDIMDSLVSSKAQYEKELEVATQQRDKSQALRDELKLQEAHFVAFKTHLANQKIDAIAAVTNGVLEDIGSDIRIEMIGFKVLKSGKVRDKITINVLRDGVDCGNINKFSAGERTRINLASIIALQRLTNANCENGRGLDLAIYDEILDASDESGIASYCEMINKMHLTSLVVTQGMVSESYKYRIVVTKQNGISTIG